MTACPPTHRAIVAELVGPAGVGKTTLARELARDGDGAPPSVSVWRLPWWLLLRSAAALLPAAFLRSSPGRPFSWRELKQLIRLHALFGLVGRLSSRRYRLLLLDEGPVFVLSWLRIRCNRDLDSSRFAALWRAAVTQWLPVLDATVLLDAPDAVLAERIRTRDREHALQRGTDQEVRSFVTRYRVAIAEALRVLAGSTSTRHFTIRTGGELPVQSAERVREALMGVSPC